MPPPRPVVRPRRRGFRRCRRDCHPLGRRRAGDRRRNDHHPPARQDRPVMRVDALALLDLFLGEIGHVDRPDHLARGVEADKRLRRSPGRASHPPRRPGRARLRPPTRSARPRKRMCHRPAGTRASIDGLARDHRVAGDVGGQRIGAAEPLARGDTCQILVPPPIFRTTIRSPAAEGKTTARSPMLGAAVPT